MSLVENEKTPNRMRVRSQVACICMLLDEIERLVDGGLKRSLTMQLFEEIERLELLLMEVEENEVLIARSSIGVAAAEDPSSAAWSSQT